MYNRGNVLMATKLYLRWLTPTTAPTSGEKSTVLPVGTFHDASVSDAKLDTAIGTNATTYNIWTSLAQTAHQDEYLARFSSDSISAQTFGSGTWTIAWGGYESDGGANARLVCSLYIWRPSSTSVVGFIYNSDTQLGTEWSTSTTTAGRTATFTGANVTSNAGDILVLEVWCHHATQTTAVGRGCQFFFNGSADFTASSDQSTTGACYISISSTLQFGSANYLTNCYWGSRAL